MKVCSKCNQSKSEIEFSKRLKNVDSLNSNCKECVRVYEKKYRKANPEKIQEFNQKFYKNNKEKYKQYYSHNKEKILNYNKYYNSQEENIERRKILRKKEYDLKYGNDVQFTLSLNVRNRIKCAIKSNVKSDKTYKLLGCSIQQYKEYLEKQFDKNMNWENYGTYWEIDHIKQIITFDLNLEENQYLAFNYKNTRPLSSKENKSRPKFG